MARKKYIISLSAEEREELEQLTTTGKVAAYKMNHARILLKMHGLNLSSFTRPLGF